MTNQQLRIDARASMSRIVTAARRVFSTGDGTGTLDKIAREAGVGIATLYRHFPNREALATAVYDEIFSNEIQPIFHQFERSDAPRELLLELFERLLAVLDRERGLTRSLADVATATRDLLSRNLHALEEAVVRARRAGNLRSDLQVDDIPQLATMITAGFGTISPGPQRRRYLSMLLDSLNPAKAQPLPQL